MPELPPEKPIPSDQAALNRVWDDFDADDKQYPDGRASQQPTRPIRFFTKDRPKEPPVEAPALEGAAPNVAEARAVVIEKLARIVKRGGITVLGSGAIRIQDGFGDDSITDADFGVLGVNAKPQRTNDGESVTFRAGSDQLMPLKQALQEAGFSTPETGRRVSYKPPGGMGSL